MPTYSPELETLGAVFTILDVDTQLKTQSGINPQTGAARAVTVHNMVKQDQPVPYVRIEVTDSLALEDEAHDIETQPTALTVYVQVQVFSNYEPELYSIMGRIRALLQHTAITTDHFAGSTWWASAVTFVDNISDPETIYRRGSIRIRVNLNAE